MGQIARIQSLISAEAAESLSVLPSVLGFRCSSQGQFFLAMPDAPEPTTYSRAGPNASAESIREHDRRCHMSRAAKAGARSRLLSGAGLAEVPTGNDEDRLHANPNALVDLWAVWTTVFTTPAPA